MRIVYDTSARVKKGDKSLNKCLLRGLVILLNQYGLLIRFRIMLIGIVGDLEKAFLNVGLQTQDRDVTRFIWLKDPTRPNLENNIQVYASTKRGVLKVIAANFDLLGYFSLTILEAKFFMKSYGSKYQWDSKLDDKMLKEWNQISENLKAIPSHHIPRYIGVNVEIKGEVMYSYVKGMESN